MTAPTIQRSALRLFAVAALLLSAATAAGVEPVFLFSPRGGCAIAIVQRINAAQSSIDIMAYSIAETQITTAIVAAQKRGIAVRMVVNRTQENPEQSTADTIRDAGVQVRTDRREPLMHTKAIIIDRRVVICGSFNFSSSAENRNAESLIIFDDPTVAQKFDDHFATHFGHADHFVAKRP